MTKFGLEYLQREVMKPLFFIEPVPSEADRFVIKELVTYLDRQLAIAWVNDESTEAGRKARHKISEIGATLVDVTKDVDVLDAILYSLVYHLPDWSDRYDLVARQWNHIAGWE